MISPKYNSKVNGVFTEQMLTVSDAKTIFVTKNYVTTVRFVELYLGEIIDSAMFKTDCKVT